MIKLNKEDYGMFVGKEVLFKYHTWSNSVKAILVDAAGQYASYGGGTINICSDGISAVYLECPEDGCRYCGRINDATCEVFVVSLNKGLK